MDLNTKTGKVETLRITFEPELVSRFWQQNAMRLMRANERILHGFMAAATREMELAQELMRYNLTNFSKFSGATGPQTAEAGQQNAQELKHILAGLREVSEGLWKTYGDVSRLLLEGSLTEAHNLAAEPVAQAAEQADAAATQILKTIIE